MASKSIVAKDATYNGVESVTFPVSGGGDATFYEISDTTAAAADVASGKYFYTALGVLTQGTASGGGGGYTLLASGELNGISSTSTTTTAITAQPLQLGSSAYTSDKILYVKIRRKSAVNGYHYGNDCFLVNSYEYLGQTSNVSSMCSVCHYMNNNQIQSYGPLNYGITINTLSSSGEMILQSRYNSTNTKTINGDYNVDVYLLDWVNNISPYSIT